MENYIVSARKYRPTTFESVVGQKALTTTLKNAIATGKLAHAYLFCGPRGVGKTTCARIFAKTINCMNITPNGEACNQCESCTSFNEQRSYNIHELDAASNNSVDDIRQLVEQVRIPPQIGKYKIYIIDEVHMLSTSAFNAFLKTLEEPPHHAIFILATTEKHKIIPTILSRCQIYDFSNINIEDTVAHLAYVASQEGITVESEALNVIAMKAEGGMRDALSIFDQIANYSGGNITYESAIKNMNVLDYKYFLEVTEHLLQGHISEPLLLLDKVLKTGYTGEQFIIGLGMHFRELMMSRDIVTMSLINIGESLKERFHTQAMKCSVRFLYKAMKLCNDTAMNYKLAKNQRLFIELTLITLAQYSDDEDAVSGGRSPQKTLKPIFSQAATAQQSQPANSTSQQVATTKTSQSTTDQQSTHSSQTGALQQQSGALHQQSSAPQQQATNASATNGNVHSAPSNVINAQAKDAKKVPVMKMSGLGLSIKQSKASSEEKQEAENAQSSPSTLPEEDYIFNEKDVNYYWQEYAGSLPFEQNALSKRMQLLKPAMLNDVTFEVVVDNEIAAQEFTALIPTLQDYLRKKLKNSKAAMTVRISEANENTRAYSRTEKFQMMAQKNEVLMQLKNEFGLELY